MGMNVYSSFNRLKNIPLDLTCVYLTLEQAKEYVEREYSKAYAGQVIAVYGDESDVGNNGVYNVILSDSSDSGLGLQKSANAEDLAALKKEIDEEVKQKIDDLEVKFDDLKNDLDAVKEELSDEFFKQIAETKSNVDALAKNLEAAKEDLNAKIDKIYGGTNIEETLDTIKEISDWIVKNQNLLTALVNVNQTINSIVNDEIPALRKKDLELTNSIEAINKSITTINSEISALKEKDAELEEQIEELDANIDKHKSFTLDVGGYNTFKVTDVVLDTVEIYVESSASDKTSFYCSISDDAGNDELLISTTDVADEFTDNNYSLLDITNAGCRYVYNLGYPITGAKYIKFQAPTSSATDQLKLQIRFTISKATNYTA